MTTRAVAATCLRCRAVGTSTASASRGRARQRRTALVDRAGSRALLGLCVLAGLLTAFVLVEIAYQVIDGARPAISHFGLHFLANPAWAPNFSNLGAATVLFGTAVSRCMALVLATPLAIAIALYLAMLAPRWRPRDRGAARRDARGDPERGAGTLGRDRAGPVRPATHRAVAALDVRLPADLRQPRRRRGSACSRRGWS